MSRVIISCGIFVDTLVGGISLLDGGGQSWGVMVILGVMTVVSPVAMHLGSMLLEVSEQPEILTPVEVE